MVEKIHEIVEDLFIEYFYTNKLTGDQIDAKNDCTIEQYAIANKATFYLVKFKDVVIASIYDDSETCIISNYSRRNDGEGSNLKDGQSGEPITH